jgi:hypothetical protein
VGGHGRPSAALVGRGAAGAEEGPAPTTPIASGAGTACVDGCCDRKQISCKRLDVVP